MTYLTQLEQLSWFIFIFIFICIFRSCNFLMQLKQVSEAATLYSCLSNNQIVRQ